MAFKIITRLTVGSDGTGLLISDLDIDFEVTRSITFSENTAGFTIYNAKQSTRKKILTKGNNVIFKVGYEDEGIGTLFIGNITDSKSLKSGADWITTLQCSSIRSAKRPIDTTYVSLSYTLDTSLKRPLQDIANALGMTLIGIENANYNLDNGYTFVGTAREALNYCKNILEANGASIYTDNTDIVIYNIGGKSSIFTPVYLDYDSGLISVEEITKEDNQTKQNPKRIQFESLIIPKLQPNGLVKINTDKIEGIFSIEKLTVAGSNYGDNSTCVVEAVA